MLSIRAETSGSAIRKSLEADVAPCVQHCRQERLPMRPLQRVLIGGAAMPPSMIGDFAHFGVDALHAWGAPWQGHRVSVIADADLPGSRLPSQSTESWP